MSVHLLTVAYGASFAACGALALWLSVAGIYDISSRGDRRFVAGLALLCAMVPVFAVAGWLLDVPLGW